MPVNAKFLQARAAEQINRVLTHLPNPPMLRLPCLPRPSGGFWRSVLRLLSSVLCPPVSVVYAPIVHLTERHRIELLSTGNAFLTAQAPLLGDVQKLLWRLHPRFMRPDGELPNQRTPGGPKVFAAPDLARRIERERAQLAEATRGLDLFEAERVIRTYLASTEQDLTEPHDPTATPANTRRGRACPEPNYFDDYLEACDRIFGLGRDEALDTPRALIRQRIRARILQQPDGYMKLPPTPADAFLADVSPTPSSGGAHEGGENVGQVPGGEHAATGQAEPQPEAAT